jgi:hypothetical protein
MAVAERTMRFAEGSPFPPIARYAFRSDRQVQALAVVHLIQAELREKRGFSMAHQIVT